MHVHVCITQVILKVAKIEPKSKDGLTKGQLEYLNGVRKVYGAVSEAEVKAALLARGEEKENQHVSQLRFVNAFTHTTNMSCKLYTMQDSVVRHEQKDDVCTLEHVNLCVT